MATLTLFLTSTATGAPRPTTSRFLSTTANASEVTLGPGEFDSGLPGNSDAGQWNPASPIANTTAAAEIDNTGATPGTARQGWLYDTDLTGQTLAAGAWTVQLRLSALQGAATETGSLCMRVSIVTYAGGAWTTVKQIFTTSVAGATSTTAGQGGWRSQVEAAFGVAAAAANFSKTVGDAGTAQSHTFASGERIFIEFGFCNANSTTDRTWGLLFNTSNSFVTTPDIAASSPGNASGSLPTVNVTAPAATATGAAQASGSLPTINVTAPTAAATGAAQASGSLPTITVTAPTATAGVPVVASGDLPTVTVSPPLATATGAAQASGSLPTVVVSAPTATATGAATASAALPTTAVTAPTASATGAAQASGSLPTTAVAAPAATATGAAQASAALPTVTVAAPTATATGAAQASGSLPTVNVAAPAATATGGGAAPGNASGSLPTITVTAPMATAVGDLPEGVPDVADLGTTSPLANCAEFITYAVLQE